MKKKNNPTRVQHFIPQFILRKFTSDNGKFKFFNKRSKKTDEKVPSGAMYKEYFYEHNEFIPNQIENLLASREDLYAPIIEKLIQKIPITLEEHKLLLEFRHVMHYRSSEFITFHEYKKGRGGNDWEQRHDWKSLMGIYSNNVDIKKTQLKAIQSVITKEDAALYVSLVTPVCFVFHSKNKKFIVSDCGSLCWGNELDGMVVIVLSPTQAVMFPRINNALSVMTKLGINNKKSTVIHENVDESIVDLINNKAINNSFEYYIDINDYEKIH